MTRSSRRTPVPAHWLVPGPGHGRDDDLARLAAGYATGWCDHHGDPAPWPKDFLDPDSGWHPQAEEIPTTQTSTPTASNPPTEGSPRYTTPRDLTETEYRN